jgi:predicted nucleic acid-binding protein
MRVMLDSNVHDRLEADQAVLGILREHIAEGRIKLVSTHVQRDELSLAPEPKRTALMAIYGLTESVSTTGAVWDVSRWGECSWSTDEESASIVALMAGNANHAEDALIAATAASEAEVFVTNDARLASKIQRANLSVKVWSWDEFVASLRSSICTRES